MSIEITVRKHSAYLDVSIKDGSAVIDLGLLDANQRAELIRTLAQAIDELVMDIGRGK